MNRIKYIDGMRGVAISLVVLFHLNWYQQGFSGVELFLFYQATLLLFCW